MLAGEALEKPNLWEDVPKMSFVQALLNECRRRNEKLVGSWPSLLWCFLDG
jgi:hypothetical protein